MTLHELFPPDRVLRLRAADKGAVLGELSRRAAAMLALPAGEVSAALAAREALGSTGVGAGIAVPHARLHGLDAPAGLFARLDKPVDWAAIDGRPVDLVFLLVSPDKGGAEHLAALAAATRRLRDAAVAAAIRAAKDPAGIRGALVGS
jgi:PTS system nitrogen regulatory IIA component